MPADPFKRIAKMKGIEYARDMADQLDDVGDTIPTDIFDPDEAQRLRTNLGRIGRKDGRVFRVMATTEEDAPRNPEEVGRYWIKLSKLR